MQINVQFDTSGWDLKVAREQKRLAYNVAEALNKTTLTAQANVRAHMTQVFQLRAVAGQGRAWLLDRVKVAFASASKNLAFAELYIDQTKQRLLLAGYEDGALRTGFVGTNVAVPNPAIARLGGSIAGTIDPKLRFKSLGLKQVTTSTGKQVWRGKQRTFEIKTAAHPLGAVFERIGPGKDDIRIVYSFDAPFHLKKMLEFVDIARATMQDRWPIEWALANARNPSR